VTRTIQIIVQPRTRRETDLRCLDEYLKVSELIWKTAGIHLIVLSRWAVRGLYVSAATYCHVSRPMYARRFPLHGV